MPRPRPKEVVHKEIIILFIFELFWGPKRKALWTVSANCCFTPISKWWGCRWNLHSLFPPCWQWGSSPHVWWVNFWRILAEWAGLWWGWRDGCCGLGTALLLKILKIIYLDSSRRAVRRVATSWCLYLFHLFANWCSSPRCACIPPWPMRWGIDLFSAIILWDCWPLCSNR